MAMDRLRDNPWVVGTTFPLVTLALQLTFWDWVTPFVWFLFYPAVFFAAWLGGLRAALVATPLSAALVWYFFLPGRFSLNLTGKSSLLSIVVFVVMGVVFGIAQDQRRRADSRALARSSSLLDSLFEQSLVGVALFDRSGTFLYASPTWLRMFGYDREDELVGKRHNIDLVAPDARDELRAVMRRRLSGEESQSAFTIKGLRRDGGTIWVSAFGSMLELDGDEVSLTIAFDITARVSAEEELRKLTERFQLAEEAAAVGVFDWNIATDDLVWDDELKTLYGWDPRDPSPTLDRWKAAIHPDDAPSVMESLDRAVAGVGVYDPRFRIVLPDGRIRYLKGSGIIFRNENGAPVRMVGANYDVSHEARAESALAASEARFRAFMDSVPAVSWMQDEEGRILWVNRMFRKMWGDREYTKLKISDFQPPDVAAKLREQDLQVMESMGSLVRRNAANGPNGEPMHWHTARFAFKDAAGRTVVGATSINVTGEVVAQQRAERLLETLERRVEQRTSELEAANKELESFSYAVSHDLRAPLRAMSGFASILQEDYEGRLDADADSHIRHINDAAREMNDLIDGLLQLSRTTRADLTRSSIDVSALAERIWEQIRTEDPERHVDFEVQPGIELDADPFLTEVLLRNLLSNAWKYTSKTEYPAVSVTTTNHSAETSVRVCDNGAGFDPQHAAQLFEPFHRLHRQDDFPGIGIGLATCARIVRRHQGTLAAEGTVGGGACFTFTMGHAD